MEGFVFSINTAAFVDALLIMAKGLIGIFAVIFVLYGFVKLMNKLTNKKPKEQ